VAKAKAKVKIPLQVCILAGGLGTRLRSVLPDLPKVLAPVGDKSFLEYLVRYLCGQGFWRFVFLLGYRHEAVQECLERKIRPAWPGAEVAVSVEPEPLGTGGAAKFAQAMLGEQFFLVNGDSYLEFDAGAMLRVHRDSLAEATLAVRQVPDAGRYGSVEVDAGGWVVGFREKVAAGGPGLVNGGVYVLNRSVVESMPAGRPVSIERETFPAMLAAGRVMMSSRQDAGRFSDIGTPESYRQFQEMDF
jgi:NDP-sugar pyrophosphorylase family protein